MLPSTPTTAPTNRTASPAARDQPGPMDTRHAWRRLIPRPRGRRPRWLGSPLLALALAAWVAIGPAWSPAAPAPPAAAAPAANAASGQVPTPTPAPGESPVQTVPFQIQTNPIVPPTGPQPSDPSIQLTSPTATPAITLAGCSSPDFIFQGCPLGPPGPGGERFREAERRLEARAITSVLQQYQLPESERTRVLRYARNEVRAALFADVAEAFQTLPAERSPDYQLLVDVYTPLVRDRLVRAATAAQDEYRRWRSNPCGYEPPPGFSYELGQGACVGASRAFTPESPGIDAFVAYGVKRAYADTAVDDPRASAVFWGTSSAAVLGYGLVATGSALGVGALAPLPQSVLTVIFPYAFRAAADVGAGAASGLSAAATTAGIFAILVATVTTAVTGSMSIAREAEIPGRLEAGVNYFRNFDIETTIRNCNYPTLCTSNTSRDTRADADRALYANFMLTTLPEYPGTEPAPAAQPGDPRLVVAGSPVDWLRYKADDKAGSPRAVRLSSGPWFVDRADGAGDGEARLTLSISYKDAGGATWTARRVGNQFLIARTGIPPTQTDYTPPRQSADLSVVDASGRTVTAQVGG